MVRARRCPGPGRYQLAIDGEDLPGLAATGLHSPAELERTATITGKPVRGVTGVWEGNRFHRASAEGLW